MPRLKISDRPSTSTPRACSGDMYRVVPITAPNSVSAKPVVASAALAAGASLATPKSSTFTVPSALTMTLSGLMSRWTIPAVWAAASARAI